MCRCAICSFRTGRVEICTRISAMIFGSVPALASGTVALGLSIPSHAVFTAPFGILVATSSLATLVELLAVILRVRNFRCLNANFTIFHVIMIILEFLLMFLYMAGCAVSAGYGGFLFGFGSRQLSRAIILSVSMVFCFISIFFFGFLAVWDILFPALNWNEPLRNEPSVEEHEMKA